MTRYIYIISNSKWDDICRYIKILEKNGYRATNTKFNESSEELARADCYTTLKGYDYTKKGRELKRTAIELGKDFVSRIAFADLQYTEDAEPIRIITQQDFTRRQVRLIISSVLNITPTQSECLIQDYLRDLIRSRKNENDN